MATKQSDAAARRREVALDDFNRMLRAAGVEDSQIERAWEGSFFPYGALGDEDSSLSQEQNRMVYWADEHDSNRRKVRKLVFGIADLDARKALIRKCNEWEQAHVAVLEAIERENLQSLRDVRDQSKLSGWTGAAVNAALFVALGYLIFQVPGAIAGAVVGFFLGQRQVAQQQIQAQAQIREIEGLLQDSKDSIVNERRMPRFFSASESLSGEHERKFDHESAVANIYQAFAKAGDA